MVGKFANLARRATERQVVRVELVRQGRRDGKAYYRTRDMRFSIYWSGRDGARSTWMVRDLDTDAFFRVADLEEAREQIADVMRRRGGKGL